MKALIVYCSAAGHKDIDRVRFLEIISALAQNGIDGKLFPVKEKQQLLSGLKEENPDIVFSTSYYVDDENNEKCNTHAILENLQIPYIGSTPEILELVLSKSDLKKKWQSDQVNTPAFLLVKRGDSLVDAVRALTTQEDYPFILKPDREGNSRGLDESSIVFDQVGLIAKMDELLQSYKTVMIEKYLGFFPDMREFTVAMIGNGAQKMIMPARIVLKSKKKIRIVTTSDKETHNTKAVPILDAGIKERVIALAEKAFNSAGVRDYARCDIIMADSNLFAIEINGQPMIPDKWFESCAKLAGLDGSQYINAIFVAGIIRNTKKELPNLKIPPGLEKSIHTPFFEKKLNGRAV